MGFTSCAQSAGMKKSLHLRIYSYLKDEGLSFRVTTLFAVKYDLSVLSLWADAYNNKLLNNGRIPVTLTDFRWKNSVHCSQRIVPEAVYCLTPTGSSL